MDTLIAALTPLFVQANIAFIVCLAVIGLLAWLLLAARKDMVGTLKSNTDALTDLRIVIAQIAGKL